MALFTRTIISLSMALIASGAFAQPDAVSDVDELKIAALEALMSAPAEQALPRVARVLTGNNSDEVKERALFVLSQIDLPEAQTLLLETVRQNSGELRMEAIRMIGIGGEPSALAGLADLYRTGDSQVRNAVLEAYLIADDRNAVYEIAANADNKEDFEAAVDLLGVMDARDELRRLRDHAGMSDSLIDAYAVSGDFESLRELSLDNSDPGIQARAIEALGIIGGDEVNAVLVQTYKGSDSPEVKAAALDGLLISGYDEGVLELYRSSRDPAEKRELLEHLVMMESDNIWDAIDSALDTQR